MCGTTLALLSIAAIPTTPNACLVPFPTSTSTGTSTSTSTRTHRFRASLTDAPHTVLSATTPTTGTTGTAVVATAVVVKVLEASENERAVGCIGTYSSGKRRERSE